MMRTTFTKYRQTTLMYWQIIIQKLTNSINKDLYKLGINFQNKQMIEDSAKVAPLFIISNKIKLKNLQLKIGNSIRHTQKFKKNLQGSLSFITKQIQTAEQDNNILLAKYLQTKQQNVLLQNINYSHKINNIFRANLHNAQSKKMGKLSANCIQQQIYDEEQLTIGQLQNKKKQVLKRLQFVKKQEKQKNRILSQLMSQNHNLTVQVKNLKNICPENSQINHLRAQQAKQLQNLQMEEKKLISQISIKLKQLDQLYITNKDYKQKITDKKYQQNKQIKVLQEEIIKCREQVRQFKQKYKKIKVNSFSKPKQIQKTLA